MANWVQIHPDVSVNLDLYRAWSKRKDRSGLVATLKQPGQAPDYFLAGYPDDEVRSAKDIIDNALIRGKPVNTQVLTGV